MTPSISRAVRLAVFLSSVTCAACAPAVPVTGVGEARTAASERATDELAVRSLIDRASDAINHHEWTRLEGMLTDDVVWEALPPIGWKLEGLQAVRGFFAKNEGKVEVLSYNVLASNVELQAPDRATARSTMIELLHLKEKDVGLQIVGTYTDSFVKREGVWRFERRSFAMRYEADVPLPQRRGAASTVPGASNPAEPTK